MANVAIDLVAFRGITITPTFKYEDNYYGLNPLNQEGVDDSRQMSWGIDTGYVVSPNLTFAVSYYWGILYPDALQLHQRCPNISTWPSHRSALGSPTRQLYHRVARKLSDYDRRPGAYQNLYGTMNWATIPDNSTSWCGTRPLWASINRRR